MARFAVAHFLVLCLLTVGCSADSNLDPVTEAQQQAITEAAKGSHRLQPGEKIRVTVSGEASLSGDYQIDPSGDLSLPLAGRVKAAGLTEAELEQELSKKFRSEYLKNPKVTVSFTEFRPFYILGEIEIVSIYQRPQCPQCGRDSWGNNRQGE